MDRSDSMNRASIRDILSAVSVLSAMAIAVLDAGEVNVALPFIAADFAVAPSEAMGVVTAYQLAILVGLLPCAHLAEVTGYRGLFSGGVVVFAAAAAASAFVPSLELLVAARFVQGLGSSAIMALGIALLRRTFGSARLGKAIAWNALTVALCSASGPTIGAAILEIGDWRWIFLAGLPVAGIALLATPSLPGVAPVRSKADWLSIALHATAILALYSAWQAAGTRSVPAFALVAVGGCAFILLVRRDLARAAPFLPLDLLALRPVRVAVSASILCFAGQSAGLVALPFYLLRSLDQGPLVTGVVITSWPLSVAVASMAANRSFTAFRQPTWCVIGGAILATGLFASSVVPTGATIIPLVGAVALCGIGFGIFQLANNRTMFLSSPQFRAAAAGGMQGSARLAGQTMGTSIAAMAFALLPLDIAPEASLAIGGLLALGAALVSSMALKGAAVSPGLHWEN